MRGRRVGRRGSGKRAGGGSRRGVRRRTHVVIVVVRGGPGSRGRSPASTSIPSASILSCGEGGFPRSMYRLGIRSLPPSALATPGGEASPRITSCTAYSRGVAILRCSGAARTRVVPWDSQTIDAAALSGFRSTAMTRAGPRYPDLSTLLASTIGASGQGKS